MFDYLIVLAIGLVILLVPTLRGAVLRLLGVIAIATVAVAGIGLPVWALYEAKPWLTTLKPVVTDSGSATPEIGAVELAIPKSEKVLSPEQEAKQRQLAEERERRAEEQRKRGEEQQRIAGVAATARSVVERDRRYAAVAASSARLPRIDPVSVDLIGIRIPSWRDTQLAEREKELIRTWLQSIGLTPEETAAIYTAHGWGSVYDLWRKENPTAAEGPAPSPQVPATSVADQAPSIEPEPELESEPQPPPRQAARRTFSERRPVVPRPEPKREIPVPRRTAPIRRPAPEREVGPFGY